MYKLFIKRILDIIFSMIMLILFAPIMLIIALIVRKDGGKAIFIQERSGKNNIPFNIYKFRTMSPKNDVHNFKQEDIMTNFGRKLKNTSLDELPQLINILKGDMSFIGPRPWITDYSKYFTDEQMKRLSVRPGLTGLAQCSGRNNISIDQKILYDIKYVNNISFINDVKIIFLTIKSVLIKDGATTSKFTIMNELEELKKQSKYNSITIYKAIFNRLNLILERKNILWKN